MAIPHARLHRVDGQRPQRSFEVRKWTQSLQPVREGLSQAAYVVTGLAPIFAVVGLALLLLYTAAMNGSP